MNVIKSAVVCVLTVVLGNSCTSVHAKAPEGLRYLALRLGDGTFVHFVSVEDGAASVTSMDAFRVFQDGIKERCAEPPQAAEATIVGNYRMLDA